MITKLKTAIYNKLTEAGYNVTDSAVYKEEFPWLMVRTGNIQKIMYADVTCAVVNIVIDVFSTKPNEAEILDMEDDVTRLLTIVGQDLSFVMNTLLKSAKVLDDNAQGPVRKHGVFNYQFILAAGEQFEEVKVDDDEDEQPNEDTN